MGGAGLGHHGWVMELYPVKGEIVADRGCTRGQWMGLGLRGAVINGVDTLNLWPIKADRVGHGG